MHTCGLTYIHLSDISTASNNHEWNSETDDASNVQDYQSQ